jgi:hypothetical protein
LTGAFLSQVIAVSVCQARAALLLPTFWENRVTDNLDLVTPTTVSLGAIIGGVLGYRTPNREVVAEQSIAGLNAELES